jgi:hypothetical protein
VQSIDDRPAARPLPPAGRSAAPLGSTAELGRAAPLGSTAARVRPRAFGTYPKILSMPCPVLGGGRDVSFERAS